MTDKLIVPTNSNTSMISEIIIYALLGASLAYGLGAKLNGSPRLQSELREAVVGFTDKSCHFIESKLKVSLCGSENASESTSSRKSWKDEIARLPSLRAAFESVNWTHGDEKDALKYTAIIRGIQKGEWREKGTSKPWELARDALRPIFDLYPKLAVASQCYWCRNHDSNMYEWFTASRAHDDYLLSLIEATPHLFGQFSNTLEISDERKLSLAQNQAYLGFHGNREGFLGGVLYQKNDQEHLHHLVRNTGSAAPIMNLNWNALSFETVKLSWEKGVRVGDDLPQFTEYLLSRGHRPALRWAIWVSTEGQNSRYLGRMRRYLPAYRQLVEKYTKFDIAKGQSIDQFYSENWRFIEWSTTEKHWRVRLK